jgi:superfamily I DNA/RNA helicase
VLEASNEQTEALGVVNEIVDLIERRGYQYSDIAVLYRVISRVDTAKKHFMQAKYRIIFKTAPHFMIAGRCGVCWIICV